MRPHSIINAELMRPCQNSYWAKMDMFTWVEADRPPQSTLSNNCACFEMQSYISVLRNFF